MEKQYKAVFFDLGGTLRIALLEEAYMRHARRKMAESFGLFILTSLQRMLFIVTTRRLI